jgi:hypothetical protein
VPQVEAQACINRQTLSAVGIVVSMLRLGQAAQAREAACPAHPEQELTPGAQPRQQGGLGGELAEELADLETRGCGGAGAPASLPMSLMPPPGSLPMSLMPAYGRTGRRRHARGVGELGVGATPTSLDRLSAVAEDFMVQMQMLSSPSLPLMPAPALQPASLNFESLGGGSGWGER